MQYRKKWTCWALCGPFLYSVQTRLGHGRSRAWIPWPGGHVGGWRRQWERSRRSSSPRSPSGGRQVWLLTKRTVLSYLDWVTAALDEGDACQLHLPKWWQHDGSTVEARFSGHRFSGKTRFKGHPSENLGDHFWFLVHKSARNSGKTRFSGQKLGDRFFR